MLAKAHLEWLEGFPVATAPSAGAMPWVALRGGEQLIDSDALRRASRALGDLVREHGPVLGDALPEGFIDGARVVLDALKGPVHRREPLAPALTVTAPLFGARLRARAEALTRETPTLGPLVEAALWLCATRRASLHDALLALDRWRPLWLAHRDVVTAARLVSLATEGERLLPIVEAFADGRLDTIATHGRDAALAFSNRVGNLGALAPMPELERQVPTLETSLARLARWLVTEDEASRRRALRVFSLIDVRASLDAWESLWTKLAVATRRASSANAGAKGAAKQALRPIADASPPELRGRALVSLVQWYAALADDAFRELVLTVLRPLGPGPTSLFFLEHLRALYLHSPRFTALVVKELGRYLKATRSLGDAQLGPWKELIESRRIGRSRWAFEADLVTDEPTAARLRSFYDALAVIALRRGGDVPSLVTDWLVDIAAAGDAEFLATVATLAMGHKSLSLRRTTFLGVLALADGDAAAVSELLQAATRLDTHEQVAPLLQALVPLAKAGNAALARALFVDRLAPRIAEAAVTLRTVRGKARGTAPEVALKVPRATKVEFAKRFPSAFRELLGELASVDPNAEDTARRALGSAFRETDELNRELAALEGKLADGAIAQRARARLEQRRKNLRARLATGTRLSKDKEARLAQKLRRAILGAMVSALEADALVACRAFTEGLLGTSPLPDVLLAPRLRKYLAAIVSLDAPMRALAARVLRARAGPPPWDLRDAPENATFLKRLGERGVRLAPWLDGKSAAVRAENGQRLMVGFEDDPLAIMEMGAHFETCLSPGGFNYFSVFANAADVNKRVVYARDEAGRVVGRVLLGLTDGGGIVTFHPYAHAKEIGFGEIVRRFVLALADAMGTMDLPSGDVARLVSPDWYDDGPRDVTGRFAFLRAGSEFSASLAKLAPDEFFLELEKRSSGIGLTELTLPFVLSAPSLSENPLLFAAVFSAMEKMSAVPPFVLLRAARLAMEMGQAHLVNRELVPRLERHAMQLFATHQWVDIGIVRLFVEVAPERALLFLRRTRPRGVRRFIDEIDPERLLAAALAHERLNRPQQAVALFRLGASARTAGHTAYARDACAARLLELRAGDRAGDGAGG